jgi:hypothetical protein
MIIGKIDEGEKKIKLNLDLSCTNCGKKVPGGIQTSEKYYKTEEFSKELEDFKKNYLCGQCRDKKRVENYS